MQVAAVVTVEATRAEVCDGILGSTCLIAVGFVMVNWTYRMNMFFPGGGYGGGFQGGDRGRGGGGYRGGARGGGSGREGDWQCPNARSVYHSLLFAHYGLILNNFFYL